MSGNTNYITTHPTPVSYIPSTPTKPAHRIQSDAEAILIAHQLAEKFAIGAAERDLQRRLPIEELEEYSQSGLWGISIPKQYGGAGVKLRTVGEVFKIISAVDPSLGQIPQSHFNEIDDLNFDGTEAQKNFYFELILQGNRLGNAFSEKNSKTVAAIQTKIIKQQDHYLITGKKFYATGALLAHWIPILAVDEQDLPYIAIIPRASAGIEILNDWSGFGQKTTASGTVILNQVKVKPEHVIHIHRSIEHPNPSGASSQFLQAAIDAGIARGALQETIKFIRNHARPWVDAQQDLATQDHFTIAAIGDLQVRLRAAEAVLDLAADQVDLAAQERSETSIAEASILVAEAKILTTEIALLATNKLFELAGTRSTLAEYNLDRHWRNARTHTLHDPVRWKYYAIGNYFLNNIKPARHPWL